MKNFSVLEPQHDFQFPYEEGFLVAVSSYATAHKELGLLVVNLDVIDLDAVSLEASLGEVITLLVDVAEARLWAGLHDGVGNFVNGHIDVGHGGVLLLGVLDHGTGAEQR